MPACMHGRTSGWEMGTQRGMGNSIPVVIRRERIGKLYTFALSPLSFDWALGIFRIEKCGNLIFFSSSSSSSSWMSACLVFLFWVNLSVSDDENNSNNENENEFCGYIYVYVYLLISLYLCLCLENLLYLKKLIYAKSVQRPFILCVKPTPVRKMYALNLVECVR
ncbi:hypothetical protein EYC84_002518 [Monilinia fructicola]|uniref:Uncharacterized protein n=1 Tax=Monilinia fructicola TaxID=38448 RepID=A0A5M9JQV5_MONFR|nr:hypothetical protein EYC84_002518 [Monilinia fructicola]